MVRNGTISLNSHMVFSVVLELPQAAATRARVVSFFYDNISKAWCAGSSRRLCAPHMCSTQNPKCRNLNAAPRDNDISSRLWKLTYQLSEQKLLQIISWFRQGCERSACKVIAKCVALWKYLNITNLLLACETMQIQFTNRFRGFPFWKLPGLNKVICNDYKIINQNT